MDVLFRTLFVLTDTSARHKYGIFVCHSKRYDMAFATHTEYASPVLRPQTK